MSLKCVLAVSVMGAVAWLLPASSRDAAWAQEASAPEREAQLAAVEEKNAAFGELYRAGRFADALPVGEKIAALYKELFGASSEEYATSLNNLASICRLLGDFERAESLFVESQAITKKLVGDQHADYAIGLGNLAGVYGDMGEYERAAALYRQAIAIKKATVGEDSTSYATTANNLAVLYRQTGHFALAEPLYRQVLEIFKTAFGEEDPNYATALDNMGALYFAQGDYERAEPLCRQALAIRKKVLGENHPDYARSLSNLARLYMALKDVASAKPLYQESVAIYEKAFGKRHPAYAEGLSALAQAYDLEGDVRKAGELYTEALAVSKEAFGENHPQSAEIYYNLGVMTMSAGALDQSEAYFKTALRIRESVFGKRSAQYAECVDSLASTYDRLRDDQRAASLHREALQISLELINAAAAARDEAGQLRLMQSARYSLDMYLSTMLRVGDGAAAYDAVLNWKGATLVRQRAARLAADDAELGPLFDELRAVTRQWTSLASHAAPQNPIWAKRMSELASRKEHLEGELSQRSEKFRRATERVAPATLQRELPAGSALVDYFEFWNVKTEADKSGYAAKWKSFVAFVVRPDGEIAMFDLGEAAPIDEAIDAWRASYGGSSAAQQAGRELRERLWTPLAEAIGDAKLVLVSTDGALGKLPFAALPGKAAGTFLIEDVTLAYIPAPRMIPELMREAETPPAAWERLLVGGVDYDHSNSHEGSDSGGASDSADAGERLALAEVRSGTQRAAAGITWNALPGTAAETAEIATLITKIDQETMRTLSGAEATEEQFRALAPRCHMLHIATHGFFAPQGIESATSLGDPTAARTVVGGQAPQRGLPPGLLSGLVLAGANDPPPLPADLADAADLPEDGILTAEELGSLPLEGVRLVVLSACETGLGEAAGGEGLLGIQRAFQIAGARTTVATLWKVDDAMTRRLMAAFYRNALEKKQSYLDALRNAQLELLRELRGGDPGAAASGAGVGGAEDASRGARPPEAAGAAAAAAAGAPRLWAAFTLSGDWR